MKTLITIFALTVTISANAEQKKPPTIEASAIYRATVAAAKTIEVFEGLPHQMWDKELLAVELKRKDTQVICKFPFYTPSTTASNSEALRKLLSSADSITEYGVPKRCGGYHPDYCVSWLAGETTYHALICFGCHEIIFYDGKTSLIYDLKNKAPEQFQKLLAIYEVKRPKRTDPAH